MIPHKILIGEIENMNTDTSFLNTNQPKRFNHLDKDGQSSRRKQNCSKSTARENRFYKWGPRERDRILEECCVL